MILRNEGRLLAAPVGIGIALFAASVLAQPGGSRPAWQIAHSDFARGDEGWTVVEPGAGSAAAGAPGESWYWSAPEPFLGDRSDAWGGCLAVVMRRCGGETPPGEGDVLLVGEDQALAARFRHPPGEVRTGNVLPLDMAGGWADAGTGAPATPAEMLGVLSRLRGLWIRGGAEGEEARLAQATMARPLARARRPDGRHLFVRPAKVRFKGFLGYWDGPFPRKTINVNNQSRVDPIFVTVPKTPTESHFFVQPSGEFLISERSFLPVVVAWFGAVHGEVEERHTEQYRYVARIASGQNPAPPEEDQYVTYEGFAMRAILTGSWKSDLGPVFRFRLTDGGPGGGTPYTCTYQGLASQGHPNLFGTLTGTFDGWDYVGSLQITEGAEWASGRFELRFTPGVQGSPGMGGPDLLGGDLIVLDGSPGVPLRTYPVILSRPARRPG